MSEYFNCDFSEFKDFFYKIGNAGKGELKKELELFLEGIGNEFLRILEDEIIRRKVIDTRLLLASFHKGDANNIWEITEGGLTLEVGTNLGYAAYANDGHWTIDPTKNKHFTLPNGEIARFVPGDVETDAQGKVISFKYNPSAKGGIILKQKWVEGKHYWESALRILEVIYPKLLEAKLQDWLDNYFGS